MAQLGPDTIADAAIAEQARIQLLIPDAHLLHGHLFRHHVGGKARVIRGVFADQPPFGGQARVERRARERSEHADHGHLNSGLGDELPLPLEGLDRVVIEADDEAGEDVDGVGVNASQRGQHVLARVLVLFRFLEALRVCGLDADEDPLEVGFAQQAHQLLVLRQIQRRFRSEAELVVVFALVGSYGAEELPRQRLVADEVVVDEEDVAHAALAQHVELAADLRRRLRARLAAEHDDDVAELALERAAARELQADHGVAVELEQVVTRSGRIVQRHFAAFLVKRLRCAGLEVRAELRPDVLRFAGHDAIGDLGVLLGAERREAAAGHHVVAAAAVILQQLALPRELHAHAADADDVRLRIAWHGLDVFVDDLHLPRLGGERGEGGQA